MKVRIEVRPTGSLDGIPWPEVGEVIELPDHVAIGMLNSGAVSAVEVSKVETPEPDVGRVEKRGPGRPPKPKADTKDV